MDLNFSFNRNINGIDGLISIKPILREDNRGSFFEVYNEEEFNKLGISTVFVQDNEVHNKKGVLRGMHINIKRPQAKLIRVIKGEIYDVVIDLRRESKTFKKIFCTYLSETNKIELYIPEGFAHGYLSVTDTIVNFKVSEHFVPNEEVGFSWKSFDIYWPDINTNYILNNRDSNNKLFTESLLNDK